MFEPLNGAKSQKKVINVAHPPMIQLTVGSKKKFVGSVTHKVTTRASGQVRQKKAQPKKKPHNEKLQIQGLKMARME